MTLLNLALKDILCKRQFCQLFLYSSISRIDIVSFQASWIDSCSGLKHWYLVNLTAEIETFSPNRVFYHIDVW